MTSIEYLVTHCKDDMFSVTNPKVQTALFAIAEDVASGKAQLSQIETAIQNYISKEDIKKCENIVSIVRSYLQDYTRPNAVE